MVAQIVALLPKNAEIDEIAYADLTGEGLEEVLVAAAVTERPLRETIAFVLASNTRGQLTQVLRHGVIGEEWLPIQVKRPVEGAPTAAVFAARAGSGGYLGFIVVQQRGGVVQVVLERAGLFRGRIQSIPEGLLESTGDVDRLYRWVSSEWRAIDLPHQYLPPLPLGTVVILYVVDPARGPVIVGARSIRARVGEHVYLRRMNRGTPSRLMFSGGKSASSASWRSDGSITLLQPDQLVISIENPAYSERIATVDVEVYR